ncbi:MAG: xanthine phosphoribosyltransferase [FCB group bacterium]|nr:xanthine phosphoribosyltransferase [FCB group bacterium]
MQKLIKIIQAEASHIGGGILKVDSFINHQILPELTYEMGTAFVEKFRARGIVNITRVLTAEVSGIASALATAQVLKVPLVFARKRKPVTMSEACYKAETFSPTKNEKVELRVSSEFLSGSDRVIIIDDFLASAKTVLALAEIVRLSGAGLLGVGCVIEKVFAEGREKLAALQVPVVTLAKIDLVDGKIRAFQ